MTNVNLDDVLSFVERTLSELNPQEQIAARRLIAGKSQTGGQTMLLPVTNKGQQQTTSMTTDTTAIKENDTAATHSFSTDYDTHDTTPPKKPLSAYNIFFQMERKRILDCCIEATLPTTSINAATCTTRQGTGTSNIVSKSTRGSPLSIVDIIKQPRIPFTAEDVELFVSFTNQKIISKSSFLSIHATISGNTSRNLSEPPKRKHRKLHDAISFIDLARFIATIWKTQVSSEEHALFQNYHDVAKRRYHIELEQWKDRRCQPQLGNSRDRKSNIKSKSISNSNNSSNAARNDLKTMISSQPLSSLVASSSQLLSIPPLSSNVMCNERWIENRGTPGTRMLNDVDPIQNQNSLDFDVDSVDVDIDICGAHEKLVIQKLQHWCPSTPQLFLSPLDTTSTFTPTMTYAPQRPPHISPLESIMNDPAFVAGVNYGTQMYSESSFKKNQNPNCRELEDDDFYGFHCNNSIIKTNNSNDDVHNDQQDLHIFDYEQSENPPMNDTISDKKVACQFSQIMSNISSFTF